MDDLKATSPLLHLGQSKKCQSSFGRKKKVSLGFGFFFSFILASAVDPFVWFRKSLFIFSCLVNGGKTLLGG